MKNFLDTLSVVIRSALAVVVSPFYPNMKSLIESTKSLIKILKIEVNPFDRRRRTPRIFRDNEYTKNVLKARNFEVGDYTYGIPVVRGQVFHPDIKLKIGKFCSIGGGVMIYLGMLHPVDFVSTYPFPAFPHDWSTAKFVKVADANRYSKGDVVIGNDVWIADKVIILSGVSIGDGAIIGTGAVVAKDVEPYSIIAGNPARLIRKRFDEETIAKLVEIKWWDWPVEKINKNLNILYSNNVSEMLRLS